jgi:hypothetical protein
MKKPCQRTTSRTIHIAMKMATKAASPAKPINAALIELVFKCPISRMQPLVNKS